MTGRLKIALLAVVNHIKDKLDIGHGRAVFDHNCGKGVVFFIQIPLNQLTQLCIYMLQEPVWDVVEMIASLAKAGPFSDIPIVLVNVFINFICHKLTCSTFTFRPSQLSAISEKLLALAVV